MRKNPTPGSIALISSLLVSFIVLLALQIIRLGIVESLIVVAVSAVASFIVFYLLLTRFIYRKIKLIYKTIHSQKIHKYSLPPKNRLNDDPIGEVQEEVINWAKDNMAEIEQLKKQENFRREFLGNVSHELKTPIFNIQGYLHTLLDGAMQDAVVNEKFIAKASKNADRLAELVEDLTIISHLESGELKLKLERFDIHALTKEVFESLELKARMRKISLGFKEDCNKPFMVKADRARIHQVLTNLIVNAIKYGRERGSVQAGFYDMDKLLLVEISDDGEGIEDRHLPRLFERFYRIDRSRSREAGGSGLGLAIVKHIIEAHGQVINVRSDVGVGTTFGFTLTQG
jgi:two-component system phosphate regulon sensor histidine kinase PhoR